MSRIYFHTPTEVVEVYGSERAYLGMLCVKFASGIFDMLSWEQQMALLPAQWRSDRARQRDTFRTFITVGHEQFTDGTEVLDTVLNTVLQLGSDSMKLAARIHGQCEIHGYVEPEDGEFIASLIEQGLSDGVFREFIPLDGRPTEHKAGWEEACRVLRGEEIVVTSYSVCEGFPNQQAAQIIDSWYDLSNDERWQLGVAGIRETGGLRWAQETWREFRFGSGASALDYYLHPRLEVKG